MITQENILAHEFVGLHAEIASSANKSAVGIRGLVTDETKSTMRLRSGGRTRIIPKGACTWRFFIGGRAVDVDGSMIQKRPHERLMAWR